MLFYLIFWLYRSEQEGSDRLPHFPKAAQFTVLLCICLLSYYHTQTENVGQKKKKKFIAFQLFFYMKMEQLHLYQEMLLLLNVSHFHCITIKSSLPKNPDFFLGAHRKRRTLLQQVALSKATFT